MSLSIYTGKYHPINLTVTGTDLNTAVEITMTTKRNERVDLVEFQKSLTGGGITVTSSTTATIEIEGTDTENMAPGEYVFDVCVTEPPDRERVVVRPSPLLILTPVC